MQEVVADTDSDGQPVVRVYCPECHAHLDQNYGIKHGSRFRCDECGVPVLFTFTVETVPE
jgi:transposase-like protein